MKILHLYKDYYPVIGGIENHIKNLAEAQAAAGHQVTVLVCAQGLNTTIETLNGVKVIKAGRFFTTASMPISISQSMVLMNLKPDIAHLHSPYPLGEVANWLLRRGGATIISFHSDVIRQKVLMRFYGPLFSRVLLHADRIIATSSNYIKTSSWLLPVREKCEVIPLGVDANRFNPLTDNRAKSSRLLFVGRLRYYKGLDILLKAMTRLPDVQLNVIGDGSMRKIWGALSEELGLAERVFFSGDVHDDELSEWYRSSDIFVLPSTSRAEAFGTALIEAMASGLPCITAELGTGTSWVVENNATGFVVPPANPEAMAEAISILLRDVSLRKKMGCAGRRRVEQFFSQEQMILKVENLYKRLL
jgi:rhamnosyl/mannosyltransferase